tara:strand:+ start:835 stop:1053 length:219 start_codon:yes stop_codon:yes gene_type:complete
MTDFGLTAMDYQPFYNMNILVSDPMLQALQENKPYLIFMAVLTFYLIMFLHITLFQLYKTIRQPKKRPYLTV